MTQTDRDGGRKVGDLAAATGLTVRTLHYYEQIIDVPGTGARRETLALTLPPGYYEFLAMAHNGAGYAPVSKYGRRIKVL